MLYAFKGSPNDASEPSGTLISGASGNLYGTLLTSGRAGCGGGDGCGAVFELTPSGTETVLHFFTGKRGDGGNPVGGVIADGTGNMYGTTLYGGGHCQVDVYGCGTVFGIAPDGTETILYSFSAKNGANGALPSAGLAMDRSGNLYGTAIQGGAYGYGTAFEITP